VKKWIKAVLGRVWDEMAPAAGHGSSEVAAAMYTGSAMVMYPRAGEQGMTMEQLRAEVRADREAGVAQDRTLERGGRGM
jgi:hypothetical protein